MDELWSTIKGIISKLVGLFLIIVVLIIVFVGPKDAAHFVKWTFGHAGDAKDTSVEFGKELGNE